MSLFKRYSFIMLILFSPITWASNIDCIHIHQKAEQQVIFAEQGQYRFANDIAVPPFNYTSQNAYSDYLNYAKARIAKRNPQADFKCPIKTDISAILSADETGLTVKDLVAPFELKQNNQDKVVLLIHGLTDSPYHFHDLAGHFYQQGFNVRTLLLPGHGTAASDLIELDKAEWQQATTFAIESSLSDYQQVYLGGFSTGGALILDYLMAREQVSEQIKGILLWSPASKAKSDLAWAAQYVSWLSTWIDQSADTDFAKYESFPYNAAAQVHALMNRVNGQAGNQRYFHNVPMLTFAAQNDSTISTSATITLINEWYRANPHSATELVYYGDELEPALLKGIKLQQIPANKSCQSEDKCVLDIAHTALINAPTNEHYGVVGYYRNCGHYPIDSQAFSDCKSAQYTVKGELTEDTKQHYPVFSRLTYNPHYSAMLEQINQFIN
ncbi:alpha/beta fold hydrolase [Catenovulum sp. SM1970]|uniref:alpha/beta hydrolase n=1 Tax=Marinifaba aquimaris TaxID=2741323 RepID=UPI001571F20D|nr:alpha/beta fold hydrolase [Marinifaba aquimaris]NTS75749.1 alpha/beta fold hydrolase [Marinifaba aquimaris]